MGPPNVSLNALRTFDAAARRSSFTAAADELSVTQAAVSQQVRSLEDQLGAKLFLREARGLTLTAFGEDLAAATREALALVEASIERITGTAEASVLTVSTLPSFASRWLVNVVQSALVGDATALTRLSLVPDDVEAGRLVTLLGFALALEHGTSLVYAESRRRDERIVALRAWLEEEVGSFERRMAERSSTSP